MTAEQAIHDKERDFHDAWARTASELGVDIDGPFTHETAVENRFILAQMGVVTGKRLLDIGCGLGESTIFFARRGAIVTATDISPGMIDLVVANAAKAGVAIMAKVTPAERLDFPAGEFDLVYAANLVHHIPPAARPTFYAEIARVLKPGGKVYFIDPLAYNPVINVYRAMASAVRTPDEQPVRLRDLREFTAVFPQTEVRYFWITSLIIFLKFFLIDRVHPNMGRYWKMIYAQRSLWWWRPFKALDAVLTRIPGVRLWLSWNVVSIGTKQR